MSYFLPEHYVPESLLRGGQVPEVVEELQQRHSALNGLSYTIAQCRFISILQATLYYGTHFYHVTQVGHVYVNHMYHLGLSNEVMPLWSEGLRLYSSFWIEFRTVWDTDHVGLE